MSEKEKLKNAVLRCLDAGYGELVSMEPIERFIKNREKAKNEALANAEKAFQYMADFFPHCCEDCPCDEFRNKSEQQLVEIRSVMGKA